MRSVSLLLSLIAVTIVVATSSGFCEENSTLSIADLQAFTDASRQLREEGRLEPFSLEEGYPKDHPLTLGEWTITVHRLGGSRAFVIVGLTNSKRSDNYGDVFADAALSKFAQKKDLDVQALFVPYRIARPDDSAQSMLAIGTKESIFVMLFASNFYYRHYIPIKDLSISWKPALFFRHGEDERGKHLQILATDESNVSRLHLGGAKTAVIRVYPGTMEALSSLKPQEEIRLAKMPRK
jgi:hypothetical protein